jgi:rhamnogalacturonan hydrolase
METVYVPPGDYGMSTFVSLTGGKSWALQLDGIIYRVGYVLYTPFNLMLMGNRTGGGNMIFVGSTSDFEMYSSTSKGAMQGYGYTFHTSTTLFFQTFL